jgi:cob(I)alamin adenosyltransferase
VFEALGDVDELNSSVGIVREFLSGTERDLALSDQLSSIQSKLLDVGSAIATPSDRSTEAQATRCRFDTDGENTKWLEALIDEMDAQLPSLTNFILPSGGKAASFLHLSRSIARRAERRVVSLQQARGEELLSVLVWMNRLSDYLFVAARFQAAKEGREEVTYKKA